MSWRIYQESTSYIPCREEYFLVDSSLSRHKVNDSVLWQKTIKIWHAGSACKIALVNHKCVFLLLKFGNEHWRRSREFSVLLCQLPLGKHYPQTCHFPLVSVVRQRHACGRGPQRPSWLWLFQPRLRSFADINIQDDLHDPQRWLQCGSIDLWFRPWVRRCILASGILSSLPRNRLQGHSNVLSYYCSVFPWLSTAFWPWRYIGSLHIVVSWQQPAGAEWH